MKIMKKALLWVFLVTFCFLYTWTYSYYTKDEIRIYYNKFYSKILEKYSSQEEVLKVLNNLELKLDNYIKSTKNENNLFLLNSLKEFNKDSIEKNKVWEFLINTENDNIWINILEKDFIDTNIYLDESYTYKELENKFYNFYDLDNPVTLIDWIYYSYKFSKYLYFENNVFSLYWKDLQNNKIDNKTTLLIKDSWKYYFSNYYEKVRLTNEEVIKWIANKEEFLKYLLDDNRFYVNNYDKELLEIKKLTQDLIKWKNKDEEKIYVIYKWIVDNIDYYSNYSDWNKYIFSGIYTFKNKTWVCDWYTKIFLYMLSFAWINDVEVVRWFAFDNKDFPEYWHAWVRVWNDYYDPTFDDPIIISWEKIEEEFLYYKLPKELLYVNRFEDKDKNRISEFNGLGLEERKQIVLKNMYELYDKYSEYIVMKNIGKRKDLWLKYYENLTLEKLKKSVWFYEVNNFTFYDKDWYSKRIASLKYYSTDDETLNLLLNDRKIDFKNLTLLKWTDSKWTEYRLAYDISFR